MGTVVTTIRVGQKPTKEQLKRIRQEYKAAKKRPYVYDPDCPPSSPEALAEFAAMARELRKKRKKRFFHNFWQKLRFICEKIIPLKKIA